jgi:hypothetical protein
MAEQFTGTVEILDTASNITITFEGENADISAGGNGRDGDIVLNDGAGNERVRVASPTGTITIKSSAGQVRLRLDGNGGNVWLGGNGADGDLVLFRSDGDNTTLKQATVHLDAQGGNGWFGGKGSDGDLVLFPSSADDINNLSQATIHLDAQSGDIKLSNADCAEEFDVSEPCQIEPGTVMVFDREGRLQPSNRAYDKKVAGVVSGAGDYRPGIVLDQKPAQEDRIPISLVGKVYCKVNSDYAPIEVGDLLTTSPTPGYAMKADDPLLAFGAVIGKALRDLQDGQGLIPILVAIQ